MKSTMHRAITIKHRIVRRVDIDRAPLATFDTIDLGDEDIKQVSPQPQSNNPTADSDIGADHQQKKSGEFLQDGGLKSETIGGNNSKKSLSQAGGEEKEGKDDRSKDRPGCSDVENVQEIKQSKGVITESLPSETKRTDLTLADSVTQKSGPSETRRFDIITSETQKVGTASSNTDRNVEKDSAKTTSVPTLARQGTIGRVNIPIKKQDSDSSSSSPGSGNEPSFNFQTSRPSVGQFDKTLSEGQSRDIEARRDVPGSLVPEYLDPSQILSPSKRKAYERRIERLKVTTSPIARPRSNAPINVVSLEEYAAISPPEPSPATPAVQDKLKITLPSDEFTSKPKTPKLHSAKRQNSEDICFEFTEEFLFSRTKSALVVTEDGQLPLSPRRVLIPPNLTPTTSPKLSASPRLSPDSCHDDLAADAPKLIYIQQSVHKLFGATADECENENWANFPDFSQTDEIVDHDTSTSTVCDTQDNDLQNSALSAEDLEWTSSADPEASPSNEFFISKANHSQLDVLGQGHGLVCDDKTEIISDQSGNHFDETSAGNNFDIELSPFSQSERYSADCTFHPITPTADVPVVELDPEFESEEIITIEINQSATGREIGIGIKSGENSQSVSPVCFDWSTKPLSSVAALPSEIFDVPQDSLVLSHSSAGFSHPVPPYNLSNASIPETDCSLQQAQQHLAADKCQTVTTQSFHQDSQTHLTSPFGGQVLLPHTSTLFSTNDSAQHQLSPQENVQLTDERSDLRPRPPSTNPFDIDFEPPVSDPFNLLLPYPGACTNPFLEQPSSVPGDLIVFSSSIDHSSA